MRTITVYDPVADKPVTVVVCRHGDGPLPVFWKNDAASSAPAGALECADECETGTMIEADEPIVVECRDAGLSQGDTARLGG